jgi:hypothetical protein
MLKKIINAISEAQRIKANHEVARQLHNSEFSHETFEYVLRMVNEGTIYDKFVDNRLKQTN